MVVNQLKAGAVLNYVVIGLNSLVGLLYTPYMLRMMGQSEYGLYSLVASVIAYLTIMDFGFGNAIIRYTAKFRAEGRQQEQYAMFGMFLILYSVIGILAFGAGLGLYFNVEALFGDTMTVVEVERAKVLMIILIFNLAVTFPLSIFGAVVTAYEDFIFQKVVQIVRILLNTVVMICLLKMGYRAVAMVVVQTLFNLVTLLLNYYYCRRKIGIRIVFGRFRWGFLREVTVYSFWIFLNAIMDRIYWGTGQFVLGATVGTAAVAVFAVAIYLKDMYYSFSTSISGVFLPKVTAMITTGASEQTVSDLFIRIGRIQYIVLAYVLSAFILLGRPFIALWAGEGYDETYVIALMFFASTLIPMIQNLGITILQARNEMKYRSILILAVSAASLAAAIPAARQFGAFGVAAVTSVAVVLGHGILLNIYYKRKIHLDIPLFWTEIARMSVAPLIITVGAFILLKYISVDSVLSFLCVAVVFSLIYFPCIYRFSMNQYERDLFIKPIRKIVRL